MNPYRFTDFRKNKLSRLKLIHRQTISNSIQIVKLLNRLAIIGYLQKLQTYLKIIQIVLLFQVRDSLIRGLLI